MGSCLHHSKRLFNFRARQLSIQFEAASRVPRLYGVRRNLEKNPFNRNTAQFRTLGFAPCCQFLRRHLTSKAMFHAAGYDPHLAKLLRLC